MGWVGWLAEVRRGVVRQGGGWDLCSGGGACRLCKPAFLAGDGEQHFVPALCWCVPPCHGRWATAHRCTPRHAHRPLQAVRFARKRLGGAVPLKVVNFDWHGNMGRLTEEKGIEGFWSFMDPVLRQVCRLIRFYLKVIVIR